MQANELSMAVTKVVESLGKANIASVVDQYRAAKGDQRTQARAGLSQAANTLLEEFASMKPAERQVAKSLHLDSLGSREYWVELFASAQDPKRHQGEIVRLASRVMFASNHLPGLINLVKDVNSAPQIATQSLDQGDDYLCIRLTDAGERASDPDRVARSIDGIDMLYSACASIARKPATDIRIDSVTPKRNRDRDIVFAGSKDSVAAVYAVINSIPSALAQLDPEQEINLDSVVQSLPVFQDLNILASTGAFSKQDIKDISDTMHQGALLTLESGVIPLDAAEVIAAPNANQGSVQQTRGAPGPVPVAAAVSAAAVIPTAVASADQTEVTSSAPEALQASSPIERDEHYDRYLKEREAMLQAESGDATQQQTDLQSAVADDIDQDPLVDKSRKDAVDDLLKSLGQSRGH